MISNIAYFHLGENNTDLVKTRGDELVEKNRNFFIDYPKNSQSLEFHSHKKGTFFAQYLRKYCWESREHKTTYISFSRTSDSDVTCRF